MPSCEKLLEQARRSPANMRFSEICQLAECYGFQFARGRGSHRLYKEPGRRELMNFQDDGGRAKEYQVKQLLAVIEELTAQQPPDEEGNDAQI